MRAASAAAVLLPLLALRAPATSTLPPTDPEVRMDERIELLAAVELVAGADRRFANFHTPNLPYVKAAEAWFAPYAKHPAVALYSKIAERGFSQNRFDVFALSLGPLPELKPVEQLDYPLQEAAGGAEALADFRKQLADFAKASRFAQFWESTEQSRAELVESAAAPLRGNDARERLRRYTGLPIQTRYTVVVTPFAPPVLGNAIDRRDPDGTPRILSVYGPDSINGPTRFRLDIQLAQVWRNILTEELAAAAEPLRPRFEASRALFTGQDCAFDWFHCAQRNVAFAVGARMLYLEGQHRNAEEWPVKYARIGIASIAPLADALREGYEPKRSRYKTLLDFYPELIKTLDRSAAAPQKLEFVGSIADVLRRPGPAVLIAPDEGPLRAKLEALRASRWPEAPTLSGADALKADLKGKLLLVGGTPKTNAWLAARWDDLRLPARVDDKGLAFNPRPGDPSPTRMTGALGFATEALNPDDPTRPVLLYTGSDEAAAAAAVDAGEIAGDFAVYEGGREVKLGSYEKTRIPWRVK